MIMIGGWIGCRLERRTGVFFDVPHLRQMLRAGRWAAASSYVRGFVKVGDCSREADTLLFGILFLHVMADLAAGRDPALFKRAYDSLHDQPDCHHLRRILQSMRSDRARACRLYHRLKPMAVQVVLNLVANCPELKDKTRLPHCTLHPASVMSLAPRFSGCSKHLKSKAVRIPANILACSFLRKRPPLLVNKVSRVLQTPVLHNLHDASPGPVKLFSVFPDANTGMNHSRLDDAHFDANFEQYFDPRKCAKRLRTTGNFGEAEDV